MEFRRGVPPDPTLVLFPGAWNPPTCAHLALARAAAGREGPVVFVIPRAFPHKEAVGPDLEARVEWLLRLARGLPRCGVAVSEGGLFIEMAREAKAARPDVERVVLLCGRDAAERIAGWPYAAGEEIERQLEEYELLVASRRGPYVPPPHLAARVHSLPVEADWDEVCSTVVRERLARGEQWAHLVPESIRESVAARYGAG
jgi:nicotinic acid mononucleotide adenylyltransferase